MIDLDVNDSLQVRQQFFKELEKYFNLNYPEFTITNKKVEWFAISRKHDLPIGKIMVNARVEDGHLHDISVFLSGKTAKIIFDELFVQKERLESLVGHPLCFDRNNNKDATRIGQFSKYSTKLDASAVAINKDSLLNFDLKVEQVAKELVKLYDVFMPKVTRIVNTSL